MRVPSREESDADLAYFDGSRTQPRGHLAEQAKPDLADAAGPLSAGQSIGLGTYIVHRSQAMLTGTSVLMGARLALRRFCSHLVT